jgi:hypothetical protein
MIFCTCETEPWVLCWKLVLASALDDFYGLCIGKELNFKFYVLHKHLLTIYICMD